jgi:hypothetical protein
MVLASNQRDTAHEQAAMDAGGLVILFGANWVDEGSRWVGLSVEGLAIFSSMYGGLGVASMSPGPGVKGTRWQAEQIVKGCLGIGCAP